MKLAMKLNRKEFLQTALAMAGFGFAVSRVAACGGDTTPSPIGTAGTGGGNANACIDDAPSASIGSNHGHVLTVSQADVAAGTAKTYSIMGTSLHDHSVSVSASDFTKLRSGEAVQGRSTNTGHDHTITIMCG